MKKRNTGKLIGYGVSYGIYLLAALLLVPLVLWLVQGWVSRTYQIWPLLPTNVLCWVVLAVLLLFRTHQSTGLGQKGVFLSFALFLLSLCLTAFLFFNGRSEISMILLTVEEFYDTALLLRAKRHTARLEENPEKTELR